MESIRPTMVEITPEKLEKILEEKQKDYSFFEARDKRMEEKIIHNILNHEGVLI